MNEPKTPEQETHRIVCPASQCTCGKGGGKWLCTVQFDKGSRCKMIAICPNKKSRELTFSFNAE
jgi:hypothetical protein